MEYLTRKEASLRGIKRKEWKKFYKKPGRLKEKRIHTHKTQTPPTKH